MEKKQVLIITLLIVAIIFSLVSIIMNLSLGGDFEKISDSSGRVVEGVSAGSSGGSVGLIVENPVSGGKDEN